MTFFQRTGETMLRFALMIALAIGSVGAVRADDAAAAAAEAPAAEATEKSAVKGDHGHAKGDHGHHDETDLSHANAGHQLEAPEEFKSDMAIYSFVVFLLLAGLLLKFAWKPIMQGLEKREHSIATMIADAKASNEKAEASMQQHQLKLAAVAEETRELMAQARRDGEALREKLVAEAQQAAQKERERAIADINAAKDVALREIAQKSVDTAVALAGKIVRREVKSQEHTQLIREALENFPSKN